MNKYKKDFFSYSLINQIDPNLENNYYTPILRKFISEFYNNKKINIVDLGCGNAKFSIFLKKNIDCNLVGVDSNKKALSDAKKNGVDQTVEIHDFNNDRLFAKLKKKYDLIICKDVLEHLVDPSFFVDQINQITKKDGYFIVSVPNHFSFYGRLKFLFFNNLDTWKYFPDYERWNYPHIRFYTYESILKLMDISGFEVIRNYSNFFPNFPLMKFMPSKFVNKLAYFYPTNFAEGFVIICRKKNFNS